MNTNDIKSFYLKEFQLFNGECFITFNILDFDTDKMTITLAVTNQGKISQIEYDLFRDKNNDLYFNYGIEQTKVEVNNFED
ncbi:MAG: hypothetical protein KBT30_02240 [Clostridiales bacterium]|nr:hypothetical protein [Candidatus Apopatousia equi]